MTRRIAQGLYGLFVALALAWTGLVIWSLPAPTHPWSKFEARPKAPTAAAASLTPPRWVGVTGSVRLVTIAGPCQGGSTCLVTPYGTVGVGPLPTAAVGSTAEFGPALPAQSATIWQVPVQMNEWRAVASAPTALANVTLPDHGQTVAAGSVRLLRATGPWLVALAYSLHHRVVAVEAINLVGGHALVLATLPATRLQAVAVGSGRVMVNDGFVLRLYTLPANAQGAPSLAVLPLTDQAAVAESVAQGYDAPGASLPGLRQSPPPAPGLVPYVLGTWLLPFRAPRGWMMVPPETVGTVTIVKLVNPRAPSEWVELREDPDLTLTEAIEGQGSAAGIGLPTRPSTRIAWISDVVLAFSTPARTAHTTINGVLYPSPTAGTIELEVSLPAREKPLATAILNSVGLPY